MRQRVTNAAVSDECGSEQRMQQRATDGAASYGRGSERQMRQRATDAAASDVFGAPADDAWGKSDAKEGREKTADAI